MDDKEIENTSENNKNSNNNMPYSNIGLLMDVSINVTVELGRAKLSIREILSLGEGSIIELQKLAGEPIDLLVNGKLIAKGEVVVIDESFGVRITDIVDSVYMAINNNNKK
ncbi:flagellar motor switch protein FliN [Brachyspira sp.]|uniref:flagellar motor switch protein FliN n=1 Tax=Brachyspira sp. TaxID=1977261 RepID=UPI002601D8E0|nr:flagellar motor switch protein FliN [Brachyspira sp.]